MEKKFFCAKDNGKLNYKRTILTGFGFMATSIAWAIYDPYITKILNKLLLGSAAVTKLSNTLVEKLPILADLSAAQGDDIALPGGGFTLVPLFIGIIMTFDNIFGVIFQPAFGKLSDRCHSKLGKRRPFIVYGAPVSALLFLLIPIIFLKFNSVSLTMLCVILFVFTMSLWRAPVVALMPDLTPPALRSEGNAVINLMGGIGSAVGMVAGTIGIALCTLFTGLSKTQIKADETVSFPYVFAIGSLVMIIGMLVVLFFVKEPSSKLEAVAAQNQAMDAAAKARLEKELRKAEKAARNSVVLSKSEKKSLVFMLGCLFFLFCGTNAITTFFSLFAQEILHMITSEATILMTMFAVCSGVAALPAGKLGKKFGRKKTIMAGLAIFLSAFVIFFGIFIAMLGNQNLSIKNYVTVNNSYIAVNDQLNEFNSEKSDLAKENDTELSDADTLSMEKYIEYRAAVENGADVSAFSANYAEFDAIIMEQTELCDSLLTVSEKILGKKVTTVDAALTEISGAVANITRILGILIYPVLVLGGAANMFITVNTLPLVLEIGGIEKVGTFTGYYYTATFSAQIASPIIYGFIRMFAGTYMSLFYYSPVMFALSIIFILFVKHGEAVSDDVIKAAKEANED